jgi:hypothetical protein
MQHPVVPRRFIKPANGKLERLPSWQRDLVSPEPVGHDYVRKAIDMVISH